MMRRHGQPLITMRLISMPSPVTGQVEKPRSAVPGGGIMREGMSLCMAMRGGLRPLIPRGVFTSDAPSPFNPALWVSCASFRTRVCCHLYKRGKRSFARCVGGPALRGFAAKRA
jgi:hypothetical protein